jgi:hypothetical protein
MHSTDHKGIFWRIWTQEKWKEIEGIFADVSNKPRHILVLLRFHSLHSFPSEACNTLVILMEKSL